MFLNRNKRKVNLRIDSNVSNNSSGGGIPSSFENGGSNVKIDSPHPMELSSQTSVSSADSSPSSVTMRKKFKMFSDECMDTSPTSPVTLINYTHQPFDDFKKPFDCFVEPMDPSKKSMFI